LPSFASWSAIPAVDVAGCGPGVDRQRGAGDHVVLVAAVRDELDPAALAPPVGVDDAGELGVGEEGVDAAPLGEAQGLEDLLVGVVGLDELGDVEQVARVGPAPDQVPAHDHAAHLERPEPGAWGTWPFSSLRLA
jgi:hypothetical protein